MESNNELCLSETNLILVHWNGILDLLILKKLTLFHASLGTNIL